MENVNSNLSHAAAIAQFRLAMIAPVLQDLYPDASRNAYYRRITAEPLTLPDGSKVTYSPKTICKWVSAYQRGGIDALMPKERSDKGATRVLSDEAIAEIYSLKEKYPRLNATQIYIRLVKEGVIPETVNVCAVQRFIKKHDLKSACNPNMQDRKAFEEDAFGKMWQADTCYLPWITENGQSRQVYCLMIIDDHSRLAVGGGAFYSDSAYNFQKVFKQAVATHGIPCKLLVDNGSSYANEQLSLICGSIGTVLIHAKPRDAATKGKIERFFRSFRERVLNGLDPESIHSLAEFDSIVKDYMREYNTTVHSGIHCTPMERYLASANGTKHAAGKIKSREWLEMCFLNRVTRKVRKDSTISIDKVLYDVPLQFISMTVEVRYLPDDMSSAFILYDGKQYPIKCTNKYENCRTKRNNSLPEASMARGGN